MNHASRTFCTLCAVLGAIAAQAAPPVIEISEARPLFVFAAPKAVEPDLAAYAERLVNTWYELPPALRDCGAFGFDLTGDETDLVETAFLLDVLRGNGVAACATVARAGRALSVETVGDLIASNPNLVAIHADRIPLPRMGPYGGVRAAEPAPELRWLTRILDLCAGHGRFMSLEWSTTDWLRVLSEPDVEPLYRVLQYYAPYSVPVHPMENPTVLTATGALTGLWLEGAGDRWGVALSPEWYESTDFVRPGEWGQRDAQAHAPPSLYRAMALAGAMGGATVYRFEEPQDLWFGDRGYQWAEAIAPTLRELVELGAIPRRDVVGRTVQVAYQCGTADAPVPVEIILREVNPAYGSGGLERVVYGAGRPRAHPDLFPNRGGNYLVPLVSPYAGAELTGRFKNVVAAGAGYTVDEWSRLLESMAVPETESVATVVNVGRSVFVMHNRENVYERQAYRIRNMPAPVRGIKARRTESGVELEWPFRENDFAYTVYRRVLPELTFEPIARNLDVRTYVDTTAPEGETVAYALTALTNEPEAIEGAVNWGEYRVYSAAVSRIEEEVLVLPETEIAISAPVTVVSKDFPAEQPLWPAIKGLSVEDTEIALEVAARLEGLREAVAVEDADFASDLFARGYTAADGSNAAFASRVFEAFFARYDDCRLFFQPQDWFVETITEPQVAATLYVQLSGVASSAPAPEVKRIGRTAVVTFGQRDGDWRIISAESPFPALADVAP